MDDFDTLKAQKDAIEQRQTLAVVQRITDYLCGGGLMNHELAKHDAVRDLLIDCREQLRSPAPTPPSTGRPEPFDFVKVLQLAKGQVESSTLYRRFIDGTPLENDIAVWMTTFAAQCVRDYVLKSEVVPPVSGEGTGTLTRYRTAATTLGQFPAGTGVYLAADVDRRLSDANLLQVEVETLRGVTRIYEERLKVSDATLAAKEAELADTRMFPIQNGPDIPWAIIAPFDKQCQRNHGRQTLERMAKRGGLGVTEAIAVLHAQDWDDRYRSGVPTREAAILELVDLVEERKIGSAGAKLADLRRQVDEIEAKHVGSDDRSRELSAALDKIKERL